MKTAAYLLVALLLAVNLGPAQETKKYPAHWGAPPPIQTRDMVELPDGYGRGSSSLAKWIAANLEKDKTKEKGAAASAPQAQPLFENNFETAEAGKLPEAFEFAVGDFTVKADGTNKFLELPGTPLDSYSVQFGPVESADLAVSGRIFGTMKGRRAPTFGIGLGGVGGFKLQVAAAKKTLELLKDQEIKTSVAFDWKGGDWTRLHLQIRKLKDGEWKIEGKAWPQDAAEPKEWLVTFTETEEPLSGKASVIASPFAGTPIAFDNLAVEKVAPK